MHTKTARLTELSMFVFKEGSALPLNLANGLEIH